MKLIKLIDPKPGYYKPSRVSVWCGKPVDLNNINAEVEAMAKKLIAKVAKLVDLKPSLL